VAALASALASGNSATECLIPEAQAFAHRAARLCADAGRAFNRGQRAFFFALGYLGWFLGPLPLALTTAGVALVAWRRQFNSDSRRAFDANLADKKSSGEAQPRRAKPSPSKRR